MGGLAHAGPPAVDCPDSGSRGGLAAVCSHQCFTTVFPADRHSVDHHWDFAPDPGALAAGCDVAVITGIVYATGLQDSYFTSLYLLVIIVASILLSRRAAFVTAASCLGSLLLLTALVHFGRIPQTSVGPPSAENLRMWFLSNSFGFLAIAYLSSLLAQSLQRKSSELEAKREELMELQDFTADIIHSMRGGLVTTDMEGRVVLLNRTGEEILGQIG